MYLTMTVTNGANTETVTVPAIMGQKYETIITPTKDDHDAHRPILNGDVKDSSQLPREETVNGDLSLPAIPVVDSKTEVAIPPAASIKQASEPLGLTVETNGQKGELTTRPALNNSLAGEDLLPSTKLQRLLKETNDIIVCPGVYDGFSARIALSVGFKALYMVS